MRNILIYFSIKYKGDYKKIYQAIYNKEKVDELEIEKIKKSNIKAITIIDDNYPIKLKTCFQPPLVLFYKGDISLLNNNCSLAIVGSRNASSYGIEATKYLLKGLFLKKDVTIISGLARGIDTIAHLQALEWKQKTIAILGCGINNCYPKGNEALKKEIEEYGLVLSEYPDMIQPRKEYFPLRNRIISALSDGVLVTSAKNKSGTKITVNYALEQGKNIFTIPYPIFEESYCNQLIKQGAIPVVSSEDIIDFL